MARVLVIHHSQPGTKRLLTYVHHLHSLRTYSKHQVFYLNTAHPNVPEYLTRLEPDLVVFHHTFLSVRQMPDQFARLVRLVEFTKRLDCTKVLIAQDEQVRMDLAVAFIKEFGVTHVFSPAPASARPRMYEGVDFDTVAFHTILNGYVDDTVVRKTAKRARLVRNRPIDVGYRTWYTQPFYGRHGQLKQLIGSAFSDRAPEFGLVTDISRDMKDALWGDRWFDFLLKCKYTIGVEGGCSVFDWDGTIARRTSKYVKAHPDAEFEEIEARCFPGLDGQFECYSLSPRHLEAVITKTCQVLVEGEYGGVLLPGTHYIELKRDFSNLDEVLAMMARDDARADMVQRAYDDVVISGRYSYKAFADLVFAESLAGGEASRSPDAEMAGRRLHPAHANGDRAMLARNRTDDTFVLLRNRVDDVLALARNRVDQVLLPAWSNAVGVIKYRWGCVREAIRRRWSLTMIALAHIWFDAGLGNAWWRIRSYRPGLSRQALLDAAVMLVGEERLWRLTIRGHNIVRRIRRQDLLDAQSYMPTEAERARREKKAARSAARAAGHRR